MGLGQKGIFTGIVKREKGAIVLDCGNGPALELAMNGFNPAADLKALEAFVGKRVRVEGIEGSGRAAIFIDGIAAITVLGPPGRPSRPPQP